MSSWRWAQWTAACVCVITLAGCGYATSHNVHTHPSAPAVSATDETVNYADPQAVCGALARTLYTHDAAKDARESDSYARIRPYVTAALYGHDGGADHGRNSVQWQQWVTHRAHTEVAVEPFAGDGLSPPGTQAAAAAVAVTPIGADGWRGQTTRHNVFCHMAKRTNNQLRVSRYDTEDLIDTA